MSDTRVRFAPSPTGFFHIGGARTALFNWLYARHTGGKFILRIEDTDRARNTDEALRVILEGMRWLGMDWDEGPGAGGEFGPYYQSERGEIYREHLELLRKEGRAYDHEGAVLFRATKEPQVIDDAVRGRVERTEEKDFVIFRSDGSPVFHFVNVVDDLTMRITHVIRGEDHLSNTSKHCELFKAFGAEVPHYAHIPLILKQDGPGKMSKRDKGSLVEDYMRRWVLPEALRNYLALLGWSPKDDREILSMEELIRLFDFNGINRTNARFDERKLSFINAAYLRAMPLEQFVKSARDRMAENGLLDVVGVSVTLTEEERNGEAPPGEKEKISTDAHYFEQVMRLCQEKVRSLDELPEFVGYFFSEDYPFQEKAMNKILKKGNPMVRIEELHGTFSSMDSLDDTAAVELAVQSLSEKTGVGTGEYIHPVRLAVSGSNVGPSFYGMLKVLGKERVLRRIERFLETERSKVRG